MKRGVGSVIAARTPSAEVKFSSSALEENLTLRELATPILY